MVKLIDRFINLCRSLILDKNKLSGVIPECIHRFSKLEYVHFSKYVSLSYSTCQQADTALFTSEILSLGPLRPSLSRGDFEAVPLYRQRSLFSYLGRMLCS
jgi:hypothetical protein